VEHGSRKYVCSYIGAAKSPEGDPQVFTLSFIVENWTWLNAAIKPRAGQVCKSAAALLGSNHLCHSGIDRRLVASLDLCGLRD
jgi:hypothetical protein